MLLLFASANRDDQEYPDGEQFDVRRRANTHLSFGYGIHYCVGVTSPGWRRASAWARS